MVFVGIFLRRLGHDTQLDVRRVYRNVCVEHGMNEYKMDFSSEKHAKVSCNVQIKYPWCKR